MDTGLVQAIVLGLARDGSKWVGGYLVAHGLASSSQATSIAGGIVALAGVLLSVYDKFRVKDKIAEAKTGVIPASVPPVTNPTGAN